MEKIKKLARYCQNIYLIALFLVFFSALNLYYLGRESELDAAGWASWVQAIGSIVALIVAFQVGARQGRDAIKAIVYGYDLATRRRYDAYSNIAKAAANHCEKTLATFPVGGFGSIHLTLALLDEKRARIISALDAIPIHEVGVFEAQDALHELRITMFHLDNAVKRANTHLESFGASTPVGIAFDTSVIRLNCENGVYYSTALIEELQRPFSEPSVTRR